jgi:hypothetical protein
VAGQLLLAGSDGPAAAWSGGSAQYWIERETDNRVLIVAARCRLGGLEVDDLALIDTAAHWSVIGGELADLVLDNAHDAHPDVISMSTRHGRIQGRLHRLAITLVADDGNDLVVSGTVLIAPEWPGPPVLGYRGFLERIRIALDPGVADDDHQVAVVMPIRESVRSR